MNLQKDLEQFQTEFDIELVKELQKSYPKFKDGRIDYSDAKIAPIVTCFIMHNGMIFLAKRGNKVRAYKGKWCTVAGYYDRPLEAVQIALQELKEEASIAAVQIDKTIKGVPFNYTDKDYGIRWAVHPFLFIVNSRDITLDWEHKEMIWIDPSRLSKYDTVPMLDKSLESVLKVFNLGRS